MIPAPFDYVVADSAEHAVALLADHGDEAKLLAGGHSLLPLMKLRLATPAVLVDVGRLADLAYVRVDGGEVAIGALTTLRALVRSPEVAEHLPLLAAAARSVGDPQVRRRGTLGGTLAHADPAADLPAVALALGATLVVHGPVGRRTVPIEDFFTGFLESALAPDELLVEVRLPSCAGAGWGFEKLRRRAQDWAIVGVAALHQPDGLGTRAAFVNLGPVPLRALAAESALAGGAPLADAVVVAAEGTSPPADVHGSADYRRHLAGVLLGRALRAAGVAG